MGPKGINHGATGKLGFYATRKKKSRERDRQAVQTDLSFNKLGGEGEGDTSQDGHSKGKEALLHKPGL